VLVPLGHYYLSFLSIISLSVFYLWFPFCLQMTCTKCLQTLLDTNHLLEEFHSVAVIPIFSSMKVNLFIFTSGQKLQPLLTHTWSMAKQSSKNQSTKTWVLSSPTIFSGQQTSIILWDFSVVLSRQITSKWKSNYAYLLSDLRYSTAPSFGDHI